ncbi:MAG: hypothetical protein AB4372_40365 [Xenococcus sp. (in: cyanobacteria)]
MQLQQEFSTRSAIRNVSLVGYYGKKPYLLNKLINTIQNYLAELPAFTPYQIEQVHATILGCEGWQTAEGIISKWFELRRKEIRYLDCAAWLEYLQHDSFVPFNVYLGGYEIDRDYNFLSRDQHPYYRSFQLQKLDDTTYIPVLMGWTQKNNLITLDIDNLRRNAQQFNFLHKYHSTADSIDNDFYLRLGTINSPLAIETIAMIENQIRELLSKRPSIILPISQQSLAFAKYQDLSLSVAKTKTIPLSEITIAQLLDFYEEKLSL